MFSSLGSYCAVQTHTSPLAWGHVWTHWYYVVSGILFGHIQTANLWKYSKHAPLWWKGWSPRVLLFVNIGISSYFLHVSLWKFFNFSTAKAISIVLLCFAIVSSVQHISMEGLLWKVRFTIHLSVQSHRHIRGTGVSSQQVGWWECAGLVMGDVSWFLSKGISCGFGFLGMDGVTSMARYMWSCFSWCSCFHPSRHFFWVGTLDNQPAFDLNYNFGHRRKSHKMLGTAKVPKGVLFSWTLPLLNYCNSPWVFHRQSLRLCAELDANSLSASWRNTVSGKPEVGKGDRTTGLGKFGNWTKCEGRNIR